MIYLYIYVINYRRVNAEFNKKQKKEREVIVSELEDEDVIGFLKPEEVTEEVRSSNEVDDDQEYIDEYEFRGEQLRRLRAYNPKLDGETADEYSNRIHYMAYQEDEKEKNEKKQSELKVEERVEVASSSEAAVVVNLENDANTWYKFADGKGRYKGEWKNGLPNGKGIKHSYKDDSYIYGNFVDGYTEGYGKQTFEKTWEKTQPYYEGEFKRNNYHGKGEYHYGDGDYYKGDWKDSKYHGQGAAYSLRLDRTWVGEYKNDEKVEGNWVKGEI
jgi:hypothetical protein